MSNPVNLNEGRRLAKLATAVRESTLKRLLQVPAGRENWSPLSDMMTFADIAHHIGKADWWLFQKLQNAALTKMVGKSGEIGHLSPEGFQDLVTKLRGSGEQRTELLSTLTDAFLDSPMFDDRFGEVTVWWVIVRGNLDHEAHHRGQLAVYLRMLRRDAGS
jgi:uncharacterized damage-inducible protein DinB